MSEDRHLVARFACAGCGKQYRWKRELAGRRVKCAKCFTIMVAPQSPPSGDPEDELYDLVPDSPPPRKHESYEYDVDLDLGGTGIAMAPPVMRPIVQPRRSTASAKPVRVIAKLPCVEQINQQVIDRTSRHRSRMILILAATLLVLLTLAVGLFLRMR